MTDLERSILKTLAYFDVFNYPLTELEIYKWLYKQKVSLSEIRELLTKSEVLKQEVSRIEGFYSLKGREHICYKRKQNNNLAERKFSKAIRLVKLYRFVPYIKMVAICNSLAYSNAREDSDIDFFIITKHNKIWLARAFAIVIVKLLGSRPAEGKTKDAFCLTFFIDEERLNIADVRLGKDIYLSYWVGQLMPIYDPYKLYSKFIAANSWHKEYLPQTYCNQFAKEIKLRFIYRACARVLGFLASIPGLNKWTDILYRKIQLAIIGRNMKSLVNVDTRVIVNEVMLKFHDNDRREHYYREWKHKIYNLLNKYEKNREQFI